ncbi:MAG: penicillin-binding protein 2 [Gammaproteobacteria bacterium]|nr:penicillin-binding protein 2 [Gammaproteobacteria bacterium]MBU2058945.1 penicillin-binding protein 2 [Gammaproteobacteria bacterium]MBU2175066.1 penicillin-binding protein 2 [Gammaproteobacteria bacterium]MBU2246749.1 penicillin-binding protein 2 [Gammaproteobacteria bacterium]MBU2345935.1 penicillin-binding protein 2 [Gammaproteobacteria bacterium]
MIKRRPSIQDPAAESQMFNQRALFGFAVVMICFLVVVFNQYKLQVVMHDHYVTRADGNRIKLIPQPPNRGLIYDRNGILLAENRPIHSVELIPEQVKNIPEMLAELAKLIEITPERQQEFLKEVKYHRRFVSIAVKEHLTEQEVAIIAVNQHRLPGVTLEARLTRHYPYGELFTHAIGYIGKINAKELDKLEEEGVTANYAASRDIGKIGLERYYESQLHGQVGFQQVEVNNRGRVIRILDSKPATSGDDLILSIDMHLQQKAKELLGENRGAIVAMDPRDGAVIAFYSNPSYDPNLFVHGISGKNYRELLESPDRPLVNRVTQGVYPPASTVKPHMAILGLENGTVTEQSRIADPGFYKLPNYSRPYRDHVKWGHGWVDVYTAITKSCDTYFYDLAVKLGIDRISDYMKKFGFGSRTGIDVMEESAGLMPSKEWKRARHKQNWFPGDTVSLGIGQSYWSTTPMQLALSTAILLNDGLKPTPHMGRYFRNQSKDTSLIAPLERVIEVKNPNNWRISKEAMRQTLMVQGGTGFNAFKGISYSAGGKTGTAQVINMAANQKYDANAIREVHRDNAMFIGYAPAENPTISLTVTVENVGGGGANAAPIARKMMDYYFTRQSAAGAQP